MNQYEVQEKTLDQDKINSKQDMKTVQFKQNNVENIIQIGKIDPRMINKNNAMVLQRAIGNKAASNLINEKPIQRKSENKTGMPEKLKAGVEKLSGMSLDNVRVNYNSDKPTEIGALAYTQGTDIHVASGQEKHLPHETWHVVQQAQGRVKPTMQMKCGVNLNDDVSLENEADVMGSKAANLYGEVENENKIVTSISLDKVISNNIVQGKFIHDDIAEFDKNSSNVGGSYDLKIAGDRNKAKLSYKYIEYNKAVKVNDKKEAVAFLQKSMAEIGQKANKDSFTRTVCKYKDEETSGNKKIEYEAEDGFGYYLDDENKYWPFAVLLSGYYEKNKSQISVFYANGKYGYITEVADNDNGYDMEEDPQNLQLHVPNHSGWGYKKYKSKHEVNTDASIAEQAKNLNEGMNADALTKVLAESARWNSVKKLAESGCLKDNSKFYTAIDKNSRVYQEGEFPNYIEFKDLWQQWVAWDCKWEITDEELLDRLNNNNLNNIGNDLKVEQLKNECNLGLGLE